MIYPIHEYIRRFAKDVPEGDVTKKFRAQPKVKPPRRKPSVQNESSRSDYMKVYMEDYRGEEGKDYQKMPDKIKELRKKQKEERKKEAHKEVNYLYSNPNMIDPCPTQMLNITSSDNNVLIFS